MTAVKTLEEHDGYCAGGLKGCPIMEMKRHCPCRMLSVAEDEKSSSVCPAINVFDEPLT